MCLIYSIITRTVLLPNHNKIKMDMLSLCRKRVSNSPEPRRRSPRIAQQSHPSTAKKAVNVEMNGDKGFSNIDDSSLPAVSQRPNGSIMLRIMAKPGAKQSGITGTVKHDKNIVFFLTYKN